MFHKLRYVGNWDEDAMRTAVLAAAGEAVRGDVGAGAGIFARPSIVCTNGGSLFIPPRRDCSI